MKATEVNFTEVSVGVCLVLALVKIQDSVRLFNYTRFEKESAR